MGEVFDSAVIMVLVFVPVIAVGGREFPSFPGAFRRPGRVVRGVAVPGRDEIQNAAFPAAWEVAVRRSVLSGAA